MNFTSSLSFCWMRVVVATACLACAAAKGLAQSPLDPPLAGRPTNFSGLVGRFTITATATPITVVVEDPLVLRVVIAGDFTAGELPTRKSLRLFPPDMERAFHIEPLPDADRSNPEQKTWEFAWKLRPKSTAVRELPSLALVYFSPQLRRYQTARSEPIPLKVTPRPQLAVVSTPTPVPASFLESAAWSPSPAAELATWTTVGFIALLLSLSAMSWVGGGIVAERSADAIQTPRAAAQLAVRALRNRSADPVLVLTDYLRLRFALSAFEPSIADIDRALKRQGVKTALRERWRNWQCAVAAERFGPPAAPLSHKPLDVNDRDIALALVLDTETVR